VTAPVSALLPDAGTKIECPTLALWGERSFVGKHYDALAVWREYAFDVRGLGLPSGHFLPEEAPSETTAAVREFLR
jgi:haloacetate dehalogenase